MKSFKFKQFVVAQNQEVFRVGTDAVLLGALSNCANARNILEVGTGTGIVSLMLAQRNLSAEILAIDINEKAVELAKENFQNSPFSERMEVENKDFKFFSSEAKWDMIACNPPYFEKMETSQKDVLARQQVELNFEQLIKKVVENLSSQGLFSVIIPKNSERFFTQKCEDLGLEIQRRVDVKGSFQSEIKRCVLEYSFVPMDFVQEELVVEKAPRKYSEAYLELTKDFHCFKNEEKP